MKVVTTMVLVSLLSTAQAQNIYKSVDAQGNISYSSSVPDAQGKVEVMPPVQEPSAEAVEAARKQQGELEQALKESAEKREKAEQQRQQEQSQKRTSTVIEQRYVPYPVYPTRRYQRPTTLPTTRPVNRPR